MTITFTIEVELQHVNGKFASKEELAEQIKDSIETSIESEYTGDNDGTYECTVNEVDWK